MNKEKTSKDTQQDWGSWTQAEAWRKQSFAERTPAQRLQWLKSALVLAYRSGAVDVERGEPERKVGSNAPNHD